MNTLRGYCLKGTVQRKIKVLVWNLQGFLIEWGHDSIRIIFFSRFQTCTKILVTNLRTKISPWNCCFPLYSPFKECILVIVLNLFHLFIYIYLYILHFYILWTPWGDIALKRVFSEKFWVEMSGNPQNGQRHQLLHSDRISWFWFHSR